LNIEPIKTTWNLFVKLFEVGQDPFISTIIFTKYCHNSCQGAHQIFSPLHKNHHGQQLGRVPLFQQNYTLSYHSIYQIEKKDPDSGDIIQDVLQQ
jgi:hypothetical protein